MEFDISASGQTESQHFREQGQNCLLPQVSSRWGCNINRLSCYSDSLWVIRNIPSNEAASLVVKNVRNILDSSIELALCLQPAAATADALLDLPRVLKGQKQVDLRGMEQIQDYSSL